MGERGGGGRARGQGVTVAVLDTGVAYANRGRYRRSPDFSRYTFVKGYDFIDHTPYPNDHNGHGTFVAGTIAETTNNSYGLTGLAFGAKIMPVRVLNSEGEGDATTIAEGVRFAVNHGARVINLSLEFSPGVTASDIPELMEALRYAYRHNVVVVAAAGNEGRTAIAYPARAPHVIAVGATTERGCLADYSNDGPGLTLVAPGGGADAELPGDPNCRPELSPGRDVFQMTFTGSSPRRFGFPDGYEGTSMATPHVAATVALIIAGGVLGTQADGRADHGAAARDGTEAGWSGRLLPVWGGAAGRGRRDRAGRAGGGRVARRARVVDLQPLQGDASTPARCDIAIVGGGIVGLAVARELLHRRPRASVCVLERETELGAHQTSHNSGVIHAGVYYAPGSLKARLCVEGARELYSYCDERGIAYERCGKVIVATDPSELGRLDELRAARARQRGSGTAPDRRARDRGARAARARDRRVALAEHRDRGLRRARALVRPRCAGGRGRCRDRVRGSGRRGRCPDVALATHTRHDRGRAGDLLRRRLGRPVGGCRGRGPRPADRAVPRRLPAAHARAPGPRALADLPRPQPGAAVPGRPSDATIDGEVLIGPTALLAGARDAYDLGRVRAGDVRDTLAWPGSWRMARRWWRTGLTELHHATRRASLVRAASRYVPGLQLADVEPAFAGVRAQALARDGRLIDDFVFSATERALHVRNAPSPAATSSLAIAQHVADESERMFAVHAFVQTVPSISHVMTDPSCADARETWLSKRSSPERMSRTSGHCERAREH